MATLDDSGLTIKTTAEHLTDFVADWRAEFGAGTDVSSDSPDGVILRVFAQREAEVDEAIQAAYQAIDPDSAAGAALDNLLSILGLTRNAATYSRILSAGVTLTGTPATVVPAGTQFRVSATGATFALDEDKTIGGGGTVTGTATATATGPKAAAVGALTTIVTPVAGLSSVTNTVEATLGTDEESDEEARARRTASLSAAGRSTPDSIHARIADLDGVTSVTVIENNTDSTVSSQPPHSFQVVVLGGAVQDIVDEIWASKPAGIAMYGTSNSTTTDAAGDTQTVYYTRPTSVRVYVKSVLTVDADFPSDGTTQVKERILYRLANGLTESEVDAGDVTTGQGLVGEDVLSGLVVRGIYEVPGVVSHTGPFIEDASPPTATGNFSIGATEVATFATADITITTA